MNCEHVQTQLNAWLDGELPHETRAAVETHLDACDDCRALADDLQDTTGRWQQLARAETARAERIAARVVAQIAGSAVVTVATRPRSSTLRSIVLVLASAAAGFVAAMLMFPPGGTPAGEGSGAFREDRQTLPAAEAPAVATLVRVIGDVKVRGKNQTVAAAINPLGVFHCPSDSVIETGVDARCEFKTSNGSTVRVDHGTRLTVRRPDEISLDWGQIQCEAPEGQELRVVAAANVSGPRDDLSVLSCKPNASMWSARDAQRLQVASANGEVEVVSKAQRHTLQPGQSAEIVSGEIQPVNHHYDPLLATRWVHPLLMQEGPDNPELKRRVDQMLARIGLSKVSHLYEGEIRAMGEHAVLPLIRFLESPLSEADIARTRVASRIVADLAVTWAIGDLVQLLEHGDPQVRIDAASALERLTSLNHGREPDDWKADSGENAETVEVWKAWWNENQWRYPSLEDVKTKAL